MVVMRSYTDSLKVVVAGVDPKGCLGGLENGARWRLGVMVLCLVLAGYGRVRIISGRRSYVEQEKIYGKGRSEEMCAKAGVDRTFADPDSAIVTWVLPHSSRHVTGEAIDVDWSSYEVVDREVVRKIAESLGVTWGGNWKVRDDGHFQT